MDANADSIHCRELEKLAAAAATMDYSESVSLEQCPPEQEILRPPMQPSPSVVPSSFGGTSSQIISYIDPYHASRGLTHIVPLRSFDAHSYPKESLHSLQVSGTRIVMMAANGISNSSWPISHLTVNGANYPGGNVGIIEDDSGNTFAAIQDAQQRQDQNAAEDDTEPSGNCVEVAHLLAKEQTFNILPSGAIVPTETPLDSAPLSDPVNETITVTEENAVTPAIPEDVFVCAECQKSYTTEDELYCHLKSHKPRKRGGLCFETKIEIIQRVTAGEKKADMAEEYCVNRSTIKSIMKKSDTYLLCWKKGLFNPDSKRLKGPKREDVEEALFSWYRQAIQNETPVSGPILCNKASDFAKKLGHFDFKPSHGWLDRFKKRKKIVFGRGAVKRAKEEVVEVDEAKLQEWQSTVIPQILFEYNTSDIFSVEEVGLFHQISPCAVSAMRNQKCSGGVNASERLSLILCANMNGLEKFPLVAIGSNRKILDERSMKSLPVHYIYDSKAWLNSDSFNAWLLDMDSWLVQQNRKICLLCSPSPAHANIPRLMSIKVYTTPTFLSPLRHMALGLFKKEYRKMYLEELILRMSRSETIDRLIPKIPLLKCLTMLSSSWHSIHENAIVISFQRAGLAKYPVWISANTTESVFPMNGQSILDKLTDCGYLPNMLFEDYAYFDNNVQVCNLMRDEDILAEVKSSKDHSTENEDDNDLRENSSSPSILQVEEALGTIRRYIQYQEGAQEMYRVLGHLEFLLHKGFPEKPYILHPS